MTRRGSAMVVFLAACGGGGGGDDTGDDAPIDAPASTRVDGVVEVIQGPAGSPTAQLAAAGGAPSDGNWVVTPDGGRVTLVSISFRTGPGPGGPGDDVMLTDCTAEYVLGDPALSSIIECPFSVLPGTYQGFGVNMSTTFEVLIDDPGNGLYTDPAAPTRLSPTAPIGGAAYVTVDLSSQGPTIGLNYQLAEPIVVDEGSTPTLTIVADMIQTTEVQVAAGVPSFRADGVWQPVILFASPTGVAAAEYYNELGTTGSYNYSSPPVTNRYLRVFYGGGSVAAAAFLAPGISTGTGAAYAVDPATIDSTESKAGGYLGRDSTDTVCWASASDFTWQNYVALFSIVRGAALGAPATLVMDDVIAAPAPGPDGTYASGCPTLTADTSIPMTLVAR